MGAVRGDRGGAMKLVRKDVFAPWLTREVASSEDGRTISWAIVDTSSAPRTAGRSAIFA